jgi:hypothetical protein
MKRRRGKQNRRQAADYSAEMAGRDWHAYKTEMPLGKEHVAGDPFGAFLCGQTPLWHAAFLKE